MTALEQETDISTLAADFEAASPQSILRWAVAQFGDGLTLGTGLGPSGAVLIHMLREITPTPNLFYLDTGLLFPETYQLVRDLETALDVHIQPIHPVQTVAEQARTEGPALWSVDPDHCCALRKVAPLRDHLAHYDAWITGIRRDQGPSRAHTPIVHDAPAYGVVKINPLATWTREMVWTYIHTHNLPTNILHEQGYTSLGCIHCTKPVAAGAPERAGRWVGFNKTECGLHVA